MKILLITLDFDANASHSEVFDAIKAEGKWWHYMKWTWLIQTSKSVEEVTDSLLPTMKGKGRMLVTELHRPYQGLQVPDAWAWIRERVN
jgi:hypothetical protein